MSDTRSRRALGAFIRARREARNLTLRQLAERAGRSQTYLGRVEQGLHQPSRLVLTGIAGALGIPAGKLLARAGLAVTAGEDAGRVVREYRLARGLLQADVAAELGVTQHYISMMENGSKNVPLKYRRQLAAVLGIPPAILGLADSPGSTPGRQVKTQGCAAEPPNWRQSWPSLPACSPRTAKARKHHDQPGRPARAQRHRRRIL